MSKKYIMFHSNDGSPFLMGEPYEETELLVKIKEPVMLILGPGGQQGGFSISPVPPITNPKTAVVSRSRYAMCSYHDDTEEIVKAYLGAVTEISAARSNIILASEGDISAMAKNLANLKR